MGLDIPMSGSTITRNGSDLLAFGVSNLGQREDQKATILKRDYAWWRKVLIGTQSSRRLKAIATQFHNKMLGSEGQKKLDVQNVCGMGTSSQRVYGLQVSILTLQAGAIQLEYTIHTLQNLERRVCMLKHVITNVIFYDQLGWGNVVEVEK